MLELELVEGSALGSHVGIQGANVGTQVLVLELLRVDGLSVVMIHYGYSRKTRRVRRKDDT